MRYWLSLMESAEPNLDKVIAQMVGELGNHSDEHYVRMEMGLDPMDGSQDNTPEFAEAAQSWCDDQVNDAYWSLRDKIQGDHIVAWRVITAPKNWKLEGHPGIYWSWDKDAAEAHWGTFHTDHVQWRMMAKIPASSIDWNATVLMNAMPSYQEEKEIRIFDGAPVEVVKVERLK